MVTTKAMGVYDGVQVFLNGGAIGSTWLANGRWRVNSVARLTFPKFLTQHAAIDWLVKTEKRVAARFAA